VLQSAAGVVVDAAQHAGNAPVHQLSLRFERSQVRIHRQDPPWKVVRAFPQEDGPVLVHLHNVSGGVLAGDRLALAIEVAPGASAQLTTTGATRLYRHRAGRGDSQQCIDIEIGENAMLEYLPDPLIPYAGSRHGQRTRIRLAPQAALLWWEVLAPGRQAGGEQFAFDSLRMETHVLTATRPLLRENFFLEPRRKALDTAARMEQYSWLASLTICQEGREPAFWRGLENQLSELAQARTQRNEVLWGASALVADGVAVRGLSTSGRHVHAALADFWRLARRAIAGSESVLPRKLY
jgi:urease accessory protein